MNKANNEREKNRWTQLKPFFTIIGIFYSIAIILWLVFDHIFYLLNFIIIGTSIGLGIGLWPALSKDKRYRARRLSQVLVGGYLFFGLGFGLIYIFFGNIIPENMQFEGFWFWILAGQFEAAVLHYLIAKIIGTALFNRGWCGWACWTAAVLDLLPWDDSPGRVKHLGKLRYVHFFISTALIFILVYIFNYSLSTIHGSVKSIFLIWQIPEFWWFLIGNIIYYSSGVQLAAILKDNRAFCKYLCPITCFLKLGSKVSYLKIEGEQEQCTSCKSCDESCPMDIKISEYVEKGLRVTSSECILCLNCVNACPNEILDATEGIDKEYHEYLNYKNW